jgi:hypothetical protein
MSECTVQNALDDARARLNDTAVAGGEIFTNAVLIPHLQPTYRELFDAMSVAQSSRILRVVYWNLPANTTLLDPVGTMGLLDFSEPQFLEERGSLSTAAIASTNTATPIQVTTSAPHGLVTGADIIISGVSGTTAPWGRWFATVLSPTTFTLNGSVSDGAAGTGGTVTWSTEKFTGVDPITEMTDRDLSDHLLDYFWDEGALKFRGATTTRQLRITYTASGNAPTLSTQTIGIDNCLNFLGCRTAGRAANAKGWYQMADRLNREALGPQMEADGSGGLLRNFLATQVRSMQRKQIRRKPFRRTRNNFDSVIL